MGKMGLPALASSSHLNKRIRRNKTQFNSPVENMWGWGAATNSLLPPPPPPYTHTDSGGQTLSLLITLPAKIANALNIENHKSA